MERTEVIEIVQSAVSEMAGWMRLGDWDLNVKVGRCDDPNHVADCGRATPYMRAYITVDDQVIRVDKQDADDVRNHIRHELIHVLLAEFDLVYEVGRATMTDVQVGQFDRSWRFAVERTVRRIEAAFDGLAKHLGETQTDASARQESGGQVDQQPPQALRQEPPPMGSAS